MAQHETTAAELSPGIQEGIEFVEGFQEISLAQHTFDTQQAAAKETSGQITARIAAYYEENPLTQPDVGSTYGAATQELGELVLLGGAHSMLAKKTGEILDDMKSDLVRNYRERFYGRKMSVRTLEPTNGAISRYYNGRNENGEASPRGLVTHPPEFTGRFLRINPRGHVNHFSLNSVGRRIPFTGIWAHVDMDIDVRVVNLQAEPLVQVEFID